MNTFSSVLVFKNHTHTLLPVLNVFVLVHFERLFDFLLLDHESRDYYVKEKIPNCNIPRIFFVEVNK